MFSSWMRALPTRSAVIGFTTSAGGSAARQDSNLKTALMCSLRSRSLLAVGSQGSLVVVVFLVLLLQRRIFERHFFARLQTADDFHAGVVGQAGHDHALVEELLPGVFLLFLRLLRILL